MARESKETKTGMMSSKYVKMLLVILAGFFTFGAPYAVFVATKVLKRGIFFSFASGFLSFILGLVLIWYLIRAKILSWHQKNSYASDTLEYITLSDKIDSSSAIVWRCLSFLKTVRLHLSSRMFSSWCQALERYYCRRLPTASWDLSMPAPSMPWYAHMWTKII